MDISNFPLAFSDYLSSPPRISSDITPDFFLGNIYQPNEDADNRLISILCGGSIHAEFPYSFSLKPLNCYLLLYTENGYGKLHIGNTILSLSDHTLLFLKCGQPFRMEITVSPWDYKVFFLTGDLLDFYYHYLPQDNPQLFTLPEYSQIIRNINKLAINDTGGHIRNKLYDFRLLTDIISDLLSEVIEEDPRKEKIPNYLLEMKALFDLDYQESYSLDDLEEHFSISKYRLCREFHAYFGISPLQYLNEKRIDIAKDLLLTTNFRIHEIGSLIGIDNANHFIYLFKKKTGMTPLVFRQSTR